MQKSTCDVNDYFDDVPFLSNIGLLMTYKCQVACPHCIIEAGPDRKEEVSLADAFSWIKEIASYRNGHVRFLSLTGGEPFYNLDRLKRIAAFGQDCGLLVTAVTNAFWALTPDRAVDVLRGLPQISMLAFSTDIYHQEFIPFGRVRNAILAAKECSIPYNVAVCTENENDERYRETLRKLQETTGIDAIKPVTTFPFGRAAKRLDLLKYETSEEPDRSACVASSYPVVFPDGKVIACIGPLLTLKSHHPLLLGNLREKPLHEILEGAESNPILHAMRIWGPKRLVSIVKDAGLNQYLPEKYVRNSACYACYALMCNSKIVEFLGQLANDSEFRRKVAYARVYYLKETRMAEGLTEMR